jgi:vacuolar-type H+-ATPase subunit H
MEAKKDTAAEEKINTVKMEAKRDVMKARNEALQNLYNIVTQEEHKNANNIFLASCTYL